MSRFTLVTSALLALSLSALAQPQIDRSKLIERYKTTTDTVASEPEPQTQSSLVNQALKKVQETTGPAVADSVEAAVDSIYVPKYENLVDSLIAETVIVNPTMSMAPLPDQFFMPIVYSNYKLNLGGNDLQPDYSGEPSMRWIEDRRSGFSRAARITQGTSMLTPWIVRLNRDWLPDPPKEFVVEVNPNDHTIAITEFMGGPVTNKLEREAVKKRHWIKAFNASLQFSQAFVSPNWYQGGNNNLNMLLNLYYNVKLNQTFHPKLLFETTFQYKLGTNSTPDDSIRSYNISEDIFQINSVFGIKAWDKWYYSVTGQFKTQLFNAYPSNSRDLRSAFLSPGELNIGLGMTYNTANAKKTFTFDASISPLSYNLKSCINSRLDPTAFSVDAGKKFKSTYGSSGELKLFWQIAYNISWRSRFFAFTDYDRFYCDWENTFTFDINRYLSTQLFVHMRYDTDTPLIPGEDWKKLQLKEILSLGVTYKFSTI